MRALQRMVWIRFSFYLVQNMSLILLEKDMLKELKRWVFSLGFVKVIHVKLSDKTCKIWMLKILAEYGFCELHLVFDYKRQSIFRPTYDMIKVWATNYLIELSQEWGNMHIWDNITLLFISLSLKILFKIIRFWIRFLLVERVVYIVHIRSLFNINYKKKKKTKVIYSRNKINLNIIKNDGNSSRWGQ